MKNLSILTLLSISFTVYAQDIPLGTWRTHFSYNQVNRLANAGNKIYAATPVGLFVFDRQDNSLTTLGKLQGLQGDNISALHYDIATAQLFIGYANGDLDVIHDTEITNIDLTSNSQITGSKRINYITLLGGSLFLMTDFGLLRLDPQSLEVVETVRQIGRERSTVMVYQGALLNDSLFLATGDGILATRLTNNINLADPSRWKRFGLDDNLPERSFQVIVNYNNRLLAGATGDGLYTYSGNWAQTTLFSNGVFQNARVQNENAYFIVDDGLFVLDDSLESSRIERELIVNPSDIVVQEGDAFFIGDRDNGMVTDISGGFQSLIPSGPYSNRAFKVTFQNSGVLGIPGGYNASINPQGIPGGYYQFNNGQWSNFQSEVELPEFNDAVDAVYQQRLGRTVIASAGYGLVTINDEGLTQVIDENTLGSPLVNTFPSRRNVVVSSLRDTPEGLWILNYAAPNPLHLWQDDGQWRSFSLPSNLVTDLTGNSTQLWMIVRPRGGIAVFDKESGATRILAEESGEGGLASSRVNALAIDREGLVWVGTDQGISVVTNPFSALSGPVDAFEPIFENRPLLRDEFVTAIAVDGGDRKWIGTQNGVWLFDPQADRQLLNFTEDNSPLPTNEILDITIDPNTGEVFFATPQGILSYREGATRGGVSHQNVKVFPNPVTADFVGTVGISGLVEDAQVKITDASGKLIWQTRAAGGTATWQVNDYNGNRASSGIYFIFSADNDGEETFVGKIAVVN